MIERIIAASVRNRFLVFVFTLFAVAAGIYSLKNTPLDAIPDLSDAQVIVYTEWEGRSPDLVEDQVTYPISTAFIAAPKVRFVRGESMFGKSFVYVIFQDGTDIYWARSRLVQKRRGHRERRAQSRKRHARLCEERRQSSSRWCAATRRGGIKRRRRGGGRYRGDALRRECRQRHRRR